MKKLLSSFACLLLLAGCADTYQTVDCVRGSVALITIGPHDSSAKIQVQAYEKGGGFTKLVKEKTYQLNQITPSATGYADPIRGKDTLDYNLTAADRSGFFCKA